MNKKNMLFLLCCMISCLYAQKIVYGRILGIAVNEKCPFEGEGVKEVIGGTSRDRGYTITFSEPFSSVPSVVATALGAGNCYGATGTQVLATVSVLGVNKNSVVLQPICPNTNSASSGGLSFIAIGD